MIFWWYDAKTMNMIEDVDDDDLVDALRWRHNECDSVSNHQPHGCLLNRLFRRRSKKTSKLPVTGLCVGNSPGPVNSPHKWPVTWKMFPFDDVIMGYRVTTIRTRRSNQIFRNQTCSTLMCIFVMFCFCCCCCFQALLPYHKKCPMSRTYQLYSRACFCAGNYSTGIHNEGDWARWTQIGLLMYHGTFHSNKIVSPEVV